MDNNTGVVMVFLIFLIVFLPIVVLLIASMWKVFKKAGYEGWECIIPFYNYYVMAKIAGKPGWWVLLLLIPYISIIFHIIISIELAKKFGKSALFGVGLIMLSFIFWPILGFGDAQYLEKRELSIEDNLVEE
ncbi:MAG: DUF5684 domain-containing protein [Chitinophagales bacterium]|nr:signal peptidase I [Bacteroidota bacterium]MCB9225603.1 signal peptidase I [Chitinophagales bacterium]